jgi:putative transposase
MLARDVCCKHIVTEQLFYRWRAKYGGMDVSAVECLKELARENAKLKKIVAERALDIRMFKGRKCKKILRFLKRRAVITGEASSMQLTRRWFGDRSATTRASGRCRSGTPGTFPVDRKRVRLIRRREGLQVHRKRRKRRVFKPQHPLGARCRTPPSLVER